MKKKTKAEHSRKSRARLRRRGGKDQEFFIAASADENLDALARELNLKRGEFLSMLLINAEAEKDPSASPKAKFVRRYARLTKDGKRALTKLRRRWRLRNRKNMAGSAVIRRVVAQAMNRRSYLPPSIDLGIKR